MKKFMVMLLAVAAAGLMAAGPAKNLINNGELKLNEKGTLTGWIYPRRNSVILNNDNTIGLKQGFQGYSSYWVNKVKVEPFTSYKLEFEVKAENLGKMAGVYYLWYDAQGNRLGKERFVYSFKTGSTDGWVKVSRVINQENPVKTASVNLCFAIYNAPGDGKVFFRNISLTAVPDDDDDDDDDVKPAAPAKKK